MATRITIKYPKELSIQPYAIWDAASFNNTPDLTAVSSWPDSYGSGGSLTYIGTVQPPYVSTERLNGNKVIECDAVDSRLRFNSPTYTNDFTFSIVCKVSGTGKSGFRIFDFGFSLRYNSATSYNLATISSQVSVSFGNPYEWNVLTVTRSGTTVSVYSNGKLINTITNSDGMLTTVSAFGNANSYGVGTFMKAHIAEINTFNYTISTADIAANYRYLKIKWGL